MPRRIGHRGARGHVVENTIASFERAIELGCDEIETDVWLTDRGLIVSHDPPALSASLTLDDALDACAGRVTLNVEVKALRNEQNAFRAGARVAALIAERGADAYISSFWWPALEGAREHGAAVRRAYICSSYAEVGVLVERARAAGLWAIHPQLTYVTPELVQAAHAAGLRVHVWTANEPEDIAALQALGVDGICSDYPERVPESVAEAPRHTIAAVSQLGPGDAAPHFMLHDDRGSIVSSELLLGKRYVLYFYPKDDTPGCTTEACQFNENLSMFERANVPVIGVSRDDAGSHQAFRTKYGLHFPLVSDPDRRTHDAYGAWGDRPGRGPGVIRSTFVVGPDGTIERAWYGVTADGHATEVLKALGQT